MTKDYLIELWDNSLEAIALKAIHHVLTKLIPSLKILAESPYSSSDIAYIAKLNQTNKAQVISELLPLIHRYDCMISIREDKIITSTSIKLFACDLDGTLIQEELLVRLARLKGIESEMQEQTNLAVLGHKAFTQSFSERIALLEGLTELQLEQAIKGLNYARGALDFLHYLKQAEIPKALISSNIDVLVKKLAQELNFDYFCSSIAEFDSSKALNGKLIKLIEAEDKRLFLAHLLTEQDLSWENCLVIGDGSNDLSMLCPAGWAVLTSASAQINSSLCSSSFSWLKLLSPLPAQT